MSAPARIAEFETARVMPAPAEGGRSLLHRYYDSLFAAHGPQHWWPGRTRFEIIVGAILTQNTSWRNVEPAIRNLRGEGLLSPRAIEAVSLARLARLIRSSGYFRQKAKKLKAFTQFLRSEYGGVPSRAFSPPTPPPAATPFGGGGPRAPTAEFPLLYALGPHPVVSDASTRRQRRT